MLPHKAEFIASASSIDNWPQTGLDEVVVVGRSNVGKSSFINALLNQKNLAYVGKTPGKTQLINFFDVDQQFSLVDVPGYGYARLSKAQLEKIGKMMEDYFGQRENIRLVIALHDSRHGPTKDDLEMVEYLEQLDFPVLHVATKADKISRNQREKQRSKSAAKLGVDPKEIFEISSTNKTGFEPVYDEVLRRLAERKNNQSAE